MTRAHLRRAVAEPLAANPFLLTLLVLTVITVSRVHSYVGILRVTRPALLLVLAAGLIAIARPELLSIRNAMRTFIGPVFIGLAIVACLSVPFGISMGRAGRFLIEDYWKTLLFAWLLLVGVRHGADLFRLVWAYVIATGVLAFLSLFVFEISKSSGGYGYDANDIGLVMITGMPLALLTLQASRTARGRVASMAVFLLAVATIAASESRGAFVALLVTGAGLLVLVRTVPAGRRILILTAVAGALAIAAPPGYWDLMGTLQQPTDDYNWTEENGRRELLGRGVEYMIEYPAFGVGINNFPLAEGTISSKARNQVRGRGIRWTAAHNSYIQAGAELGVPGLLLWLTLVFGSMGAVARRSRRLPRVWVSGTDEERALLLIGTYLPVALLGFAAASFFVSFAYLEPIYILGAMAAAFLFVSDDALRRAPAPFAAAAQRRGAGWRPAAGGGMRPGVVAGRRP